MTKKMVVRNFGRWIRKFWGKVRKFR